jgi:hypothetical protein
VRVAGDRVEQHRLADSRFPRNQNQLAAFLEKAAQAAESLAYGSTIDDEARIVLSVEGIRLQREESGDPILDQRPRQTPGAILRALRAAGLTLRHGHSSHRDTRRHAGTLPPSRAASLPHDRSLDFVRNDRKNERFH